MIIYPAIDVLDGQVVRLVRGDFQQKTIFPLEPKAALAAIAEAGAQCMHLVDLSGARDPKSRQSELLRDLLRTPALKIQVGGGIRCLQEIEELLTLGADRVVLGSIAVNQPFLALEALRRFGEESLTFALDVRLEGSRAVVMRNGWAEASGLDFGEALRPFLDQGLRRVLCTDINVDGRLVGPNFDLYCGLREQFPALELQASGGVSGIEDLTKLSALGLHSVVVGRALLAGSFTLQEALQYAQ